ncbi:MAG: HD domain-containing phosphohydrolase [Spirochaetota bacterium]
MDQELVAVAVDDETMILTLLEEIAREAGIKVISFVSPAEALPFIRDNEIDMVFTDYRMGPMDGISFVRELRKISEDIPIVMVTVFDDYNIMVEAIKAGATEFVPKPINAVEFLARVRNLARLRSAQLLLKDKARQLEKEVARELNMVKEREREAILVLGRALDFRDNAEDAHNLRVAEFARLLLKESGAGEEEQDLIYYGALLHDIGKAGISHDLLLKEEPFSNEEISIVRDHAMIGSRILDNAQNDYLRAGGQIALTHHERYDGTGYPRRLKGEEIPFFGRIVAVADVFDSLTSKRPYRDGWEFNAALSYIKEKSGSYFDPYIISLFEKNIEKVKSIYRIRE